MREFFEALLLAIAPTIISEAGQSWRDERREAERRRKPCSHGRPGGRLCCPCASRRELDANERSPF